MRRGLFFKAVLILLIFLPTPVRARVSGSCSNCHTMHNSQNGLAMNFEDDETQPNQHLLRTSGCIGCHAQGGMSNVVDFSGCSVPQVMHINSTDLAAGNFAYINGTKGSGASPSKGHNVIDLCPQDPVHNYPPGGPYKNSGAGIRHPDTMPERLTCAGAYGCHGSSHIEDPIGSMLGAHHADTTKTAGGLDKPTGDTVGNSFRFLVGVSGLEVADWQNRDSAHHNEYNKDNFQLPGFPNQSSCDWCHTTAGPGRPGTGDVLEPDSGTAYLCMRCHPGMHSWIEKNAAWYRHPSNVAIPDESEYAHYTVYNVDAPVSRNVIPDTPSAVVTPWRSAQGAGNDYVTCISCHKAHATDYPDLLRWDYAGIEAGGGSSDEGCFICHSTKDE
ncbi:MAG: cytochrome c3 family protein [Pseudomonadota bacterium]|nr:cytochrome c3 family protein [Pseudomonadota bacterium]